MGRPSDTTRRARTTLAASIALCGAVLVGSTTAASGQEGDGSPTTTAPSSTTTTSPPVTVQLGDGDIGVLPPGAENPADPDAPSSGEPPPDDGEVEVPDELPVVILPDPTPGLNAALADIDVTRATRALADADEGRRNAVAAVREAFATRAEAVATRRTVGDRLLATHDLVGLLAVNVVIYGNIAEIEPVLASPSLEYLRDLRLSDVAGDKLLQDLDDARAAYRDAVATELDVTAQVTRTERFARIVEADYLRLRTELDEAIRQAEEARRQVGPTILGPAVLDSSDLVAWYYTYYAADPPVAPIEDIIEAYLRIGEEEGVVGDIAFAQAILETGGFRSGHARKFNFAGIGAYDHCSPECSFSFADLDDGVRAHLHLLRAYADPGLTTTQLAARPNPLVAPERVGVRGCCPRWTGLTGVWASDPNYDRKVLGIYRLMVETARALDRARI